ncbi:hypothetical protein F9B63_07455 [Staphylococcus epidermidis]|uniref:hypothetical protein n=1 Tax=Staphylococcus epidermidis TaxID=1282 RepID=UPI00124E8806|nr:hypothetical protein [Staphylococcus epidermidis]KAB2275170.1 hypothetical protein F9B63_07455 [Staphylococcus epidermidis]
MVKIKRKVALGPKAFLKHLLEQEETEVALDGYTFDYSEEHYSFDPEITANEFISYDPHSGTFTVEVEEKITEDTVIFRLLEVRNAIPSKKTEWKDLKLLKSYLYGNHSISEVKNEHSIAIYILNDDMTMTLIWKDGKLID